MKLTIRGAGNGTRNLIILLVPAYRSLSLAPGYFYEIFRLRNSDFKRLSLYINSYPCFTEEVDFSFIRDILIIKPDVLAFSNFFWNYDDNLKLAKLARSLNNSIRIIFGGPQTGDLENTAKILADTEYIDYILCGEADFSFPELVISVTENPYPDNIPGLAYRNEGKIFTTDADYFVKNLSTLPAIYRSDSEYIMGVFNSHRAMPLETIRGCRSHCSYCQYCINTLRYKSLKTVEAEIAFLCNNQAKYVRVCDSHFGGSPARALEIFDIIKHYNKFATAFYIYPDPDHIDSRYLKAAGDANCHIISLGIETLDDEISRAISRRVSAKSSLQALKLMGDRNIKPQVDLILGLPGQTLDSFVNDVITLISEGYDEILFSPLMVFPGTRISRERELLKLKPLPTPQNFALNNAMSEKDFAAALTLIDVYNLYKKIPSAVKYIYDRYYSTAGYRKFVEKIFSPKFMPSESAIEQSSAMLSMGAGFLIAAGPEIAGVIARLLEDLLGPDLNDDKYIIEIVRYDLYHQAMKTKFREIGEDIYGNRPSREIIVVDELTPGDLKIAENCWLEQFDFPPHILQYHQIKASDSTERTYCAFACNINRSYILTGPEYEFLSEFKSSNVRNKLSPIDKMAKPRLIKWLKAGVLISAR